MRAEASQIAVMTLCLILRCPDKAERAADDEGTEGNAVQIEEVSQAEAEATQAQQAGPSSPQKTDSPGLVQSVVDAARSLLRSKPDEVGQDVCYAASHSHRCRPVFSIWEVCSGCHHGPNCFSPST